MMKLRPLLIALCSLAALAMIACGPDAEQRNQPVIEYRDRPTAAIAGEIGVPQGMDPLGITVFAEGTSFVAFTDSQGAFTISNLKPGEYRLRAMRQDLEAAFLDEVTVTEADLSKQQPFYRTAKVQLLDRPEMRGGDGTTTPTMFGSIQGGVRTSIPGDEGGVVVSLVGTPWRTVTVPGGVYELVNVRPGSYTASYNREGYQPVTQTVQVEPQELAIAPIVELQATSDVNRAPHREASIFGRVELLLADGSVPEDYSGVRVVVEGTSYSATPDAEGRYQITNLTPDVYTVSAVASGFLLYEKVRVDLTAVPGAEVNLSLVEDTTTGSTGSIVGRVVLQDSRTGHGGVMVGIGGTNLSGFSTTDGDYSILNVPTGTYELTASFSGYKPVSVRGVSVVADGPTVVPDITLERDVEAPRVVFTSPADGARDVPITEPTRATVQFSMRMNPQTVASAIRIMPEVGFRVIPQGSGNVESFLIEMDAIPKGRGGALRYGTQYTINIAASAQSDTGVPMEEPYRFSFTTGYATIIATDPPSGARERIFSFSRPLRVYFNAPIRQDTINVDQIRFSPELVGRPNIHFETDQQTGWTILVISGIGAPDTEYRVEINRGAQTITQDPVRNLPYRFNFRTTTPVTFDEYYGLDTPTENIRQRERDRR